MSMRVDSVHLLNYVGSKRRMVGVLSQLIPAKCTVYVEPYYGSAALALNSQKFDVKMLNDFNPNIANFWEVATNPLTSKALLSKLQETSYSRTLFMEAKERRETYGSKREDKLQWAVDTYVLNAQSFNGQGDYWVERNGESYRNKLDNVLGLPLTFKQIAGVGPYRVYNMSALDFLEAEGLLDTPRAFIYMDPPYLEGLRSDGKLYACDMTDVEDHVDLLKAIRTAKAKIVLSGYWSGQDDGSDLYDYYLIPYGWHRHLLGEFSKGCEAGETRSKGAEWIWTNYDLVKEAPGALGFLKSYCDEEKSPCIREWVALQSANKTDMTEI